MPAYTYTGPVDCSTPIDTSNLKGKTSIVTGAAKGLGEAYVRALSAAGCHVVVADIDAAAGQALADELLNALFVKTDVTDWDSQVSLFAKAIEFSPTDKIHHVVANAGTIGKDDIFFVNEPTPMKPDLRVIDINLVGALYTTKLATHYFIKQNGTRPSVDQEDTSLTLIGSGASFLDCNRAPQYAATKWAMRGIMHAFRQLSHLYGSRMNVICPWYVRTNILSQEAFSNVEKQGLILATVTEAQQTLLRLVSDSKINGRSLFVSGKKYSKQGYIDLDLEDYNGNGGNHLLVQINQDQMLGGEPEKGLFLEG